MSIRSSGGSVNRELKLTVTAGLARIEDPNEAIRTTNRKLSSLIGVVAIFNRKITKKIKEKA